MPEATPSTCCSLEKRALTAGYCTLIASGLICGVTLIAISGLYSTAESNGTLIAMLCASAVYVVASLILISGVKEEKGEKFISWIIVTVINVLLSAYEFVILIVDLIVFEEDLRDSLGKMIWTIFFTLMLIFGLWSVVCLWRSYGSNCAQDEGGAAPSEVTQV